MLQMKIVVAALTICPFLSHGQFAHSPEMPSAWQESVEHDAESEQNEEHRQWRFVCESEGGSDEILYITHRLYGAARFEGEDELSSEDWREIIENPCSVEVILDWREGVSSIVDGLANHGGAEIIDRLIARSLSEGSLYLYIALAPYANADLQEKYASYFLADDAFRDAFESRLRNAIQEQQKSAVGSMEALPCPVVVPSSDGLYGVEHFDFGPTSLGAEGSQRWTVSVTSGLLPGAAGTNWFVNFSREGNCFSHRLVEGAVKEVDILVLPDRGLLLVQHNAGQGVRALLFDPSESREPVMSIWQWGDRARVRFRIDGDQAVLAYSERIETGSFDASGRAETEWVHREQRYPE